MKLHSPLSQKIFSVHWYTSTPISAPQTFPWERQKLFPFVLAQRLHLALRGVIFTPLCFSNCAAPLRAVQVPAGTVCTQPGTGTASLAHGVLCLPPQPLRVTVLLQTCCFCFFVLTPLPAGLLKQDPLLTSVFSCYFSLY